MTNKSAKSSSVVLRYIVVPAIYSLLACLAIFIVTEEGAKVPLLVYLIIAGAAVALSTLAEFTLRHTKRRDEDA